MKKAIDFINAHFDFKFYGVSWISMFVFVLVILAYTLGLPQEYGYENGVIENMQMVVLFVIMYLCFTSKCNKPFFNFIALALTLLIIREVNCGRTLFFPIPDQPHHYYSWRDLPWKWLGKIVHTVYSLYIAFVGLVFLKKKFYVDMWNLVKNIKLPVWQLCFMFVAMFMGAIAEKATNNNFVFEEGFEFLFYVTIGGIVWLYSRNRNFMLNNAVDNDVVEQ